MQMQLPTARALISCELVCFVLLPRSGMLQAARLSRACQWPGEGLGRGPPGRVVQQKPE